MEKELKIKISVDKKTGAIKVVDGELNELSLSAKKAGKSVDSFNKGLMNIAKAAGGVYALKQAFDFASEISAVGMELESMRMSLEAAVGSSGNAKKELDYLKKTTDDLGLSFKSSLSGFTQFAAAAKQTSLEGAGVEKVFTGVSEASAVMGLSIDDQNGVFRALSQMMSKGKIQAEELRGQLGERLPGAFQIAARSMDMTTSELDKFMSSGKLISDDFLPKFGKQLEKEFGKKAINASKTARAEQNRYNNALLNMKVAISNSGINDLAKDYYTLSTSVAESITKIINHTSKYNTEADFMMATASRTIDMLNVLYEVAENSAQNAVYGISSLAYGTLAPITHMLSEVTKGLNNIGLSSDENLKNALKLEISMYEKAEYAQKKIKENTKEITDAIIKASPTIEARVLLYQKERREVEKRLKLEKESNNTPLKKIGTASWQDILSTVDESSFNKLNEMSMKINNQFIENSKKASDEIKKLNTDALSLITDPLDALNDRFMSMYDNIQKLTGADTWSPTQLQKFYGVWQKSAEKIGKESKKQSKYESIGSKAWTAGLKGQAKSIANIGNAIGDLGKDQKSWNSLTKEQQKDEALKNTHLDNQLGLYGNIAGAMGSMFEEGSRGAEAMQVVQATLAVVQGAVAIINQGTGDPYTAIPRMLAMAATVAGILGNAGISGGGSGGGAGKVAGIDANLAQIDNETTLITDRLDRQIQLLESINLNGSAKALQVQSAKVTFDSERRKWVEQTLGNVAQGGWTGLNEADLTKAVNKIETAVGFDAYKVVGDNMIVNADILRQGNNLFTLIEESLKQNFTGILGIGSDYTNLKYASQSAKTNAVLLDVNELQKLVSDWSGSIISSMNELNDASDGFKKSFDDITGSMYYQTTRLNQAFSDVNKLTNGGSVSTFLQSTIDNIDSLGKFFTDSTVSLLLSSDIADIDAQIAKVQELNDLTNGAFTGGAREALNYLDSINLVTEAMTTSNDNIKTYLDGFKTDEQLAYDMAKNLGVGLATNLTELDSLFKQLSTDTFGLTDADLALLDANKSLIDAGKELAKTNLENKLSDITNRLSGLDSILSSLTGIIDKLQNASLGATYDLDKYYTSMSETLSLSKGKDIEAYQKSLTKTISASSVLFNDSNFQTQQDKLFAQAVATNQLESMKVTTLSQIDYLKLIAENTQMTIDAVNGTTDAVGGIDFNVVVGQQVSDAIVELMGNTYGTIDDKIAEWLSGAETTIDLNNDGIADAINMSNAIAGHVIDLDTDGDGIMDVRLKYDETGTLTDISNNTLDTVSALLSSLTNDERVYLSDQRSKALSGDISYEQYTVDGIQTLLNTYMKQYDILLKQFDFDNNGFISLKEAQAGQLTGTAAMDDVMQVINSIGTFTDYANKNNYDLTDLNTFGASLKNIAGFNEWYDAYGKNYLSEVGSDSSTTTDTKISTRDRENINSLGINGTVAGSVPATSFDDAYSNQMLNTVSGTTVTQTTVVIPDKKGMTSSIYPWGYANGGYTGDYGVNDIAGVVHGQEYVINAPTTKDLGINGNGGVFRELLEENKKLTMLVERLTNENIESRKELQDQTLSLIEIEEKLTA